MAIGKKSKNGVIIKSKTGFDFYEFQNDDGLRPLYNPASSKSKNRIKTLKVDSVVEIANSQISVRIHPNGNIEIEPSV